MYNCFPPLTSMSFFRGVSWEEGVLECNLIKGICFQHFNLTLTTLTITLTLKHNPKLASNMKICIYCKEKNNINTNCKL